MMLDQEQRLEPLFLGPDHIVDEAAIGLAVARLVRAAGGAAEKSEFHDPLPYLIMRRPPAAPPVRAIAAAPACRSCRSGFGARSEEHTSELQSLMRISYAVFCLKKKKKTKKSIPLNQ